MADYDLRAWAVKGAEQRLAEIAAEARGIFAAFPELRGRGRGFESRGAAMAEDRPRRGGRGRMTAAQRKAVSVRMKKYWAQRRKNA